MLSSNMTEMCSMLLSSRLPLAPSPPLSLPQIIPWEIHKYVHKLVIVNMHKVPSIQVQLPHSMLAILRKTSQYTTPQYTTTQYYKVYYCIMFPYPLHHLFKYNCLLSIHVFTHGYTPVGFMCNAVIFWWAVTTIHSVMIVSLDDNTNHDQSLPTSLA